MRSTYPVNSVLMAAGLTLAMLLGACQPKPQAPPPPVSAAPEPAASPADPAPVPLAKDPKVPLLIIAKTINGALCPTKVTGPLDSDCPQPGNGDHKACRERDELVRWLVFNMNSEEVGRDNFTIRFDDANAPFEKQGSGTNGECGSSENGALDCKVKANKPDEDVPYKYEVIMSASCPRFDPIIVVNKTRLDPMPPSAPAPSR